MAMNFLVHKWSLPWEFWWHAFPPLRTGHVSWQLSWTSLVLCMHVFPRHSRSHFCSQFTPWLSNVHLPLLQVCRQWFPWHSRLQLPPRQVWTRLLSLQFRVHFPLSLSHVCSQCFLLHSRLQLPLLQVWSHLSPLQYRVSQKLFTRITKFLTGLRRHGDGRQRALRLAMFQWQQVQDTRFSYASLCLKGTATAKNISKSCFCVIKYCMREWYSTTFWSTLKRH